ncbi:SDR family NAD(P)-dependent oxidoreductase [Niameybacter massiliensis]|uniref:SDR family NAD(P)-dependent oxidoreductase n=1 Tax=Niameybacter massiliensis TaxID=1658108 RepID=UPI0006B40267|nr:SDR family oxidoreductase [Niameybacter massiliensis]
MYALVTGATSGIGRALTYLLAKEGYDLLLSARNLKNLKDLQIELEKTYNVVVQVVSVDVTQLEEIDHLISYIKSQNRKIDLFVNNAGVGFFGAFEEMSEEEDLISIDTNIKGFTYLTKKVYPYLGLGSTVLQVASTAAFAPGPYMAVYYASKSYVLSLSMALRNEWKDKGIHVSILCPGPTKTEFIKKARMQKSGLASLTTMTPEQVAKCAYKGIKKHKAIIIPGMTNKLSTVVMSLCPIRLSTLLVRSTQKK